MQFDPEEELYIKYCLLPHLARLIDAAQSISEHAELTVDEDGMPAATIRGKDYDLLAGFVLQEPDYVAMEKRLSNMGTMLFSLCRQPANGMPPERAERMLVPKEYAGSGETLAEVLYLYRQGLWTQENTLRFTEGDKILALPRLQALWDILEARGLRCDGLYEDGERPFITCETRDGEIELFFKRYTLPDDLLPPEEDPDSDSDRYLLCMRFVSSEGDVGVSAVFPESGGMQDPDYYERMIAVFETYYLGL